VNGDASNLDIKATLLMAKAKGQPVTIVIDGREAGGAWYRIVAEHVQ
jgi:hypothetical protein